MVTGRSGHSLPELIVTIVFLAATLGAVSASTLLGSRSAAWAADRQASLRLAEAALDSVARSDHPRDGEERRGRRIVRWRVGAHGAVDVLVVTSTGERLARLSGRVIPFVPSLVPDSAGP